MSDTFGFTPKVDIADSDRRACLEFACTAARAAGVVTLEYFRGDLTVDNKESGGRFDPVTQADRAAEQVIRAELAKAHPEHGVYGEEFGFSPGNGLTWVIDPIDGTRAFMTGMVHWGVLIGLFDGENPVVGAMCQPYTEEVFSGDGRNATLQRGDLVRSLHTSACDALDDAVMATTISYLFKGRAHDQFERLRETTKLCRVGGDCYLFAMLAMGYIDIVVESDLMPYDIQALIPIVEGAGGVVSTFDNENASMGGMVLASANERLHTKALELIASV